jgi:GNAT superfamily N-acetyltransferase
MRTAPDFREEHTLAGGERVLLRHIRPADAPALARAFERLSPQSRYRRFFGGITELSDATLRYLTEPDGTHHVAIVAVGETPDLKSDVGLGVARFVRLSDEPTVADAAVTVVDEAQRKGLGRLLATTLADAARERGVRDFRADVLSDNAPMRAMMREIGALERSQADGVITYDVPLDAEAGRLDGAVEKFLRAAATSMSLLARGRLLG